MFEKYYICGVEVTKFNRQRAIVRDAIVSLDIKILEFQDRVNSCNRYITSPEAYLAVGEIIGELKFMYKTGVLTSREYRYIVCNLTGKEYIEEVY